jgi:sugar lactone lactonase YvrE
MAAELLVLAACGGGGSPPGPIPVVPTPPSITTQPTAVSVNVGQPASFTVAATGTAPITYQWQRNGADVSGATAATYTLAAAALADNGVSFRVVVTNSALAVTSSAVPLTVSTPNVAASITTPPADLRVTTPASATFTVVAAGTPAPTLQWQVSLDGGTTYANIAAATSATYTIAATAISDDLKRFRVIATNVAGAATSPGAILRVDPASIGDRLDVYAGSIGTTGSKDSTLLASRFNDPHGIAMDAAGNIYVSDIRNYTIRKITPAGVVSTLAGSPGVQGFANGTGAAASFYYPKGLAVDAAGNVFVADWGNHLLRKITPAGVVTTVAGVPGEIGGPSTNRLNFPSAVAVDAAGNLYVANTGDQTICKYTTSGGFVLAGASGVRGKTNAAGQFARFDGPTDLVLDGLGNLFVADKDNSLIRKIVISSAEVTTYAGDSTAAGFADGTGGAAKFANPIALTIDATGNLYVSDYVNNVIRKIAPGGVVTTVLGQVRSDPSADFRTGADPRLGWPI